MSEQNLKTAVIPVAGLGSRMEPFTSGVPKFMAPISEAGRSRPNIDYTLDDCLGAGIENLVVITSDGGEEQLRRYLGPISNDRADRYRSLGKWADLEKEVARRAVFADMNIEYVDQPVGPYGTAVPLSLARPALKGVEYFAVTGGDDFIWHKDGTSELALARDTWQQSGATHALMGIPVPREEGSKYGILQTDEHGFLSRIDEKPPQDRLPASPLANVSRYILRGELIWPLVDEELSRPRSNGQPEHYVTDVINAAIAEGQTFQTHAVEGVYFDAGSPQGILRAGMFITEQLTGVRPY
jgi:UTP--glucose-1-phosphate uridylyltransferase